jgi:hypothetical protein
MTRSCCGRPSVAANDDLETEALWPFTAYDAAGFLFDDMAHGNSSDAQANPDGTFKVDPRVKTDLPEI